MTETMRGDGATMTDTRLIERWLPIAALGEESVRERRSMTALPPTPTGIVRGGMGPLRSHSGRRARCRPARGQTVAPGATDPP